MSDKIPGGSSSSLQDLSLKTTRAVPTVIKWVAFSLMLGMACSISYSVQTISANTDSITSTQNPVLETGARPTEALSVAHLPNGVRISLRGIAKSPVSADPTTAPPADSWFSPRGHSIQAPYSSLAVNFQHLDDGNMKSVTERIREIRTTTNAHELALTLDGLVNPTQPRYEFTPSLDMYYPAVYKWEAYYNKDWWTYTTIIASLPDQVPDNRVNIRISLESGPFLTRAVIPADQASTLTIDDSPVIIQKPIEMNGYVHFNFVYDPRVHGVRILAVNHAGRVFRNAGNAGGRFGPANDPAYPGFSRDIVGLIEPPLDEIDYLIVQTRKLHWAEFRHIPLQPGMPDRLEVATSPAPAHAVTDQPLTSRVYNLSGDLMKLNGYPKQAALLDLTTIIESLAPDSWSTSGGFGTITLSDTSITITTTQEIHEQVNQKLARLIKD